MIKDYDLPDGSLTGHKALAAHQTRKFGSAQAKHLRLVALHCRSLRERAAVLSNYTATWFSGLVKQYATSREQTRCQRQGNTNAHEALTIMYAVSTCDKHLRPSRTVQTYI